MTRPSTERLATDINQLLARIEEIDRLIIRMLDAGETRQLNVLLQAKWAICQKAFDLARESILAASIPVAHDVLARLRDLQTSHQRLCNKIAAARDEIAGALTAARNHHRGIRRYRQIAA